jgi:hypothetical protein
MMKRFGLAASGTDSVTLEQRLRTIEDVEAIKALKAEYAAAADAKYTADYKRARNFEEAVQRQVGCFTADAVWHGGPFGGTITGKAALQTFFRSAPWRFTAHLYSAPEIVLDRDEATARWRLWELGLRVSDDRTVMLIGTTVEAYRRTPQGWKIACMRFEALHSLALADRPDALQRLIPGGEIA